jgi:hypothetical protein
VLEGNDVQTREKVVARSPLQATRHPNAPTARRRRGIVERQGRAPTLHAESRQ